MLCCCVTSSFWWPLQPPLYESKWPVFPQNHAWHTNAHNWWRCIGLKDSAPQGTGAARSIISSSSIEEYEEYEFGTVIGRAPAQSSLRKLTLVHLEITSGEFASLLWWVMMFSIVSLCRNLIAGAAAHSAIQVGAGDGTGYWKVSTRGTIKKQSDLSNQACIFMISDGYNNMYIHIQDAGADMLENIC